MRYRLVKIPGRRKWYIAWTAAGSRTKYRSTGSEDKVAAESILRAFERDQEEAQDRTGCGQLIDRYLSARANVQDPQRLRFAALPLKKFFGDVPPFEITDAMCRQYDSWRSRSPSTVRRELGMLRAALKLAGYADVKINLPPPNTPRDRFLSRDQASALLDACSSQHLHTFIWIALVTGARKSSIIALTWDRVDLERGIIDFNEPGRRVTKKRRAIVPVGGKTCALLRDIKAVAATEYVIEWNGAPITDIKTAFNRTATKAGVPWCTPHYLKHTAISWLAEDGYTIDQIADMTETDPATVKRIYRKFNPEYLRDLANSQEDRLHGYSRNTERPLRYGDQV